MRFALAVLLLVSFSASGQGNRLRLIEIKGAQLVCVSESVKAESTELWSTVCALVGPWISCKESATQLRCGTKKPEKKPYIETGAEYVRD
tara:strand:+ start:305 stop:574 length:270 start_codon:yes stop_codon:yes gene_type:complete